MNIDTDDNSRPPTEKEILERISAASKSIFSARNKALDEIITGFHPNITQKELRVLRCMVVAVHDIGFCPYIDIVRWVSEDKENLFKNEKEINDTINDLLKKGIIRKDLGFIKHRHYHDRCNCNYNMIFELEATLWLQRNVEDEALEAISDIIVQGMNEYFA